MNINICIRVTDGKDGQLFCYQPLPGRTNEEQGAPSQTLWDGIKAPWWKVLDSSWIHWMGGCSATQLPMGWIDGASVDIMQGWPTGSLGKKTIWIQRWVYHPSSQNNVHMTPFDNGYNWKLYILAHTVGILFCCVTNLVNHPYGKPKNKHPRGDGFHPTQCWQVGEWYGDGLWVCDFGCIALFVHYNSSTNQEYIWVVIWKWTSEFDWIIT